MEQEAFLLGGPFDGDRRVNARMPTVLALPIYDEEPRRLYGFACYVRREGEPRIEYVYLGRLTCDPRPAAADRDAA